MIHDIISLAAIRSLTPVSCFGLQIALSRYLVLANKPCNASYVLRVEGLTSGTRAHVRDPPISSPKSPNAALELGLKASRSCCRLCSPSSRYSSWCRYWSEFHQLLQNTSLDLVPKCCTPCCPSIPRRVLVFLLHCVIFLLQFAIVSPMLALCHHFNTWPVNADRDVGLLRFFVCTIAAESGRYICKMACWHFSNCHSGWRLPYPVHRSKFARGALCHCL